MSNTLIPCYVNPYRSVRDNYIILLVFSELPKNINRVSLIFIYCRSSLQSLILAFYIIIEIS
jgi:hypothetical protein